MHETTVGSFDDPRAPTTEKVRTVSLDSTDCSNAVLEYALSDDGFEGEIALTRVVPGMEALCEDLAGQD